MEKHQLLVAGRKKYGWKENLTVNFFEGNNLWYNLTRNEPAYDCLDAASKRKAGRGIPLRQELKTSLETCRDINAGEKRYVAFHCRADQRINYKKIKKLKLKYCSRISDLILKDVFKLSFGVVNPFEIDRFLILQIFDLRILELERMMTSAGTPTLGIEFKPKEIITASSYFTIADIAD